MQCIIWQLEVGAYLYLMLPPSRTSQSHRIHPIPSHPIVIIPSLPSTSFPLLTFYLRCSLIVETACPHGLPALSSFAVHSALIMKGLLGLSILPLLAAGSPVLVDSIHNDAAPVVSSSDAKEIPDSYMVVFKKHVTERHAIAHHSWVQNTHSSHETHKQELRKRSQVPMTDDTVFEGLRHTYNIPGGFLGYAGHFDQGVIELVRRHPDVSLLGTVSSLPPVDKPTSSSHYYRDSSAAFPASRKMRSPSCCSYRRYHALFKSSRARLLRLNSSSVTPKSEP